MNADSGRPVLERVPVAAPRPGLRGKLKSVFLLQLAAIGIATLLSVYCAWIVLRDVLIQQALIDESAHFENKLQHNPRAEPPDVSNMTGFLAAPGADDAVPPALAALTPGYHTVSLPDGDDLVYVSDTPRGRLYLVFGVAKLDRLALWFGFVPLTMALLVIYISTWLSYRVTRQAISPLFWLANEVRKLDPKHPDLSVLTTGLPAEADVEVQTLALALHTFASRLEDFVERERNFTRDASHELRSPLTVVKLATDVLLADTELPPFAQRSLKRIQRATRDMEALFEALLIMAREDDVGMPEEDFVVNIVAGDEIVRARLMVADRPIEVLLVEDAHFALHAPRRVFVVVLSNLLRSAFAYTESGVVTVTVGADCVRVEDNGAGMTPEELDRALQPFVRGQGSSNAGHGIGLTIVKRLTDRFGWRFELDSALGQGTRATIRFPNPQPV